MGGFRPKYVNVTGRMAPVCSRFSRRTLTRRAPPRRRTRGEQDAERGVPPCAPIQHQTAGQTPRGTFATSENSSTPVEEFSLQDLRTDPRPTSLDSGLREINKLLNLRCLGLPPD